MESDIIVQSLRCTLLLYKQFSNSQLDKPSPIMKASHFCYEQNGLYRCLQIKQKETSKSFFEMQRSIKISVNLSQNSDKIRLAEGKNRPESLPSL